MTILKHVLGSTGMPGSGKSLVIEIAMEKGYDVVVMGDLVRKEADKRGLPQTPENIGKTMLQLRETEGKAVMAKRSIPKIQKTGKDKVLVDGIRSLDEVDEFKKHFQNFILVATHASPETRFKRLFDRKRSDDSIAWKTFYERDLRELSVGLGNAIAMAEYIIVNEDPPEVVRRRIREVFRKVDEKWNG